MSAALEVGRAAAVELEALQLVVEAKRKGVGERRERVRQEVEDAEGQRRREEEGAGHLVRAG